MNDSATSKQAGNGSGRKPRLVWYVAVGRLVTFVILAVVLAFMLDALIRRGLTTVNTSELGSLNRIMAGRVNSEILISGSSRAQVHYDSRIFQATLGHSAFNIGCNGTHTDFQLAFLKAYLAHNKKPRVLVQNLDFHTFASSDEISDPALYAPYLGEDSIYSAFKKVNPEVWKWRYVPLYCYAVEDDRLTWIIGMLRLAGRNPREDYYLGFNPRDKPFGGEFASWKKAHPAGTSSPMDDGGVETLTEMIQLCKTNDIAMVMVFSPVLDQVVPLITNRTEIFSRFKELSRKYDVPFWDYSGSEVTHHEDYFYNSLHMNVQGAELFSEDVARRLAIFANEKALFADSPKSPDADHLASRARDPLAR